MWKKQSKSFEEKNVFKTKTKKLFSVENNSKSFDKKKPVPEKRKLRFKDMRRGFVAHEKTHVLRGGSLLQDIRFLVGCETPAHVFKTQFAYFRYGFFFLKGFTVVFHIKKLFRFCFNYVFFLKGYTLFFPLKKSFFVFFLITFFFFSSKTYIFFHTKKVFSFSSLKSYGLSLFTVMLRPPKVTKSCSKTIAHI